MFALGSVRSCSGASPVSSAAQVDGLQLCAHRHGPGTRTGRIAVRLRAPETARQRITRSGQVGQVHRPEAAGSGGLAGMDIPAGLEIGDREQYRRRDAELAGRLPRTRPGGRWWRRVGRRRERHSRRPPVPERRRQGSAPPRSRSRHEMCVRWPLPGASSANSTVTDCETSPTSCPTNPVPNPPMSRHETAQG